MTDGEGRTETDEEASIRALVEREVSTPTPDEAACRRYYEQNLKRFRSADLYEAAHILIAAHPGDRAAYAAARAEAEALMAALRDAPERFAELARRIRPVRRRRSAATWASSPPAIRLRSSTRRSRAMTPGETSAEPVASRFGHHIIRLERKIEGRQLPFEQVRDRIADYLADRVSRQAMAQYLARLASQARI